MDQKLQSTACQLKHINFSIYLSDSTKYKPTYQINIYHKIFSHKNIKGLITHRKSLFLKILVDNILNSCLCLMMFLINWCCDKEDKLNLTEKAQTCHMSSLSFGKTCAHFWRIVSLKTMKSTTKLLFFRVHECTV